jgi:hypothetical protein
MISSVAEYLYAVFWLADLTNIIYNIDYTAFVNIELNKQLAAATHFHSSATAVCGIHI